ncbi:glycosyltransferase family 2 protein [Nanoarchaeota archaeon]
MMKLWVVIPAYNEEKLIVQVLQNLKKHNFQNIVVVDDGSEDNTFKLASKQKVKVLRHIINLGQGAALRTGIDHSLDNGAQIIVTFDSDGQHLAHDIPNLIKPLFNGYDVALGSRFLNNKSKVPFVRKMFLKGGMVLFKLLYGAKVTDSHNGLRAFSRKAAEKINLTSNGMEHASEIIEEICKKKLKYKEVPVTIKYTDYSLKHGQNSFNGFRILLKMFLRKLMR